MGCSLRPSCGRPPCQVLLQHHAADYTSVEISGSRIILARHGGDAPSKPGRGHIPPAQATSGAGGRLRPDHDVHGPGVWSPNLGFGKLREKEIRPRRGDGRRHTVRSFLVTVAERQLQQQPPTLSRGDLSQGQPAGIHKLAASPRPAPRRCCVRCPAAGSRIRLPLGNRAPRTARGRQAAPEGSRPRERRSRPGFVPGAGRGCQRAATAFRRRLAVAAVSCAGSPWRRLLCASLSCPGGKDVLISDRRPKSTFSPSYLYGALPPGRRSAS
jgi:hypothetical protein